MFCSVWLTIILHFSFLWYLCAASEWFPPIIQFTQDSLCRCVSTLPPSPSVMILIFKCSDCFCEFHLLFFHNGLFFPCDLCSSYFFFFFLHFIPWGESSRTYFNQSLWNCSSVPVHSVIVTADSESWRNIPLGVF